MRIGGESLAVAAALAIGLAANAAAQAPAAPCTFGSFPYVYAGWGVPSKVGVAFSADVYWTFEQKLADGTTIRGWSRTRAARDAEGRTRFERPQGCERGEDGQLHIRMDVSVFDPVTNRNMFWIEGPPTFPGMNVVHVTSRPPAQAAMAGNSMTPEERNAAAERQRLVAVEQESGPVTNLRIDLGTETIGGVKATGHGSVREIPKGVWGNAEKFSTKRELWEAKELGIEVKAVFDDPRAGRAAYEYQNVILSEPDPSLFAPPRGFKVEEAPQGN